MKLGHLQRRHSRRLPEPASSGEEAAPACGSHRLPENYRSPVPREVDNVQPCLQVSLSTSAARMPAPQHGRSSEGAALHDLDSEPVPLEHGLGRASSWRTWKAFSSSLTSLSAWRACACDAASAPDSLSAPRCRGTPHTFCIARYILYCTGVAQPTGLPNPGTTSKNRWSNVVVVPACCS